MSLLILSVAVGLAKEELLLHVLLYLNLQILVFIIVFSLAVFVLVSLSFKLDLSQEELLAPNHLHDLVNAEGPLCSGHPLQLNDFSDAFSIFHHFDLYYEIKY